MHGKHVLYGALFGFILSRAGATDYDAIAGMFRLTDGHLFGVIGLAIAVSATGIFLLRRGGSTAMNGEPLALTKKPMTRGLVAGSLLFGVGWGVSGTCPGTALAQMGEGRLSGFVTFTGILLGAWAEGLRSRSGSSAPSESAAPSAGRTAPAR